jgi:PIN domain nuclease of toxin-antitoxin system
MGRADHRRAVLFGRFLNGYLLDTNIALLAVTEPDRVRQQIKTAIGAGPSFLSIISYWEVMIKHCKGLLELRNPRGWWGDTQATLGLQPLALTPDHIAAVYDLPYHHRDPFDRALIAQAMVEDLTFLTTDAGLEPYACDRLRIVL